MAAFLAAQSTLASTLTYGTYGKSVSHLVTPNHLLRFQRNAYSAVRCISQDEEKKLPMTATSRSPTPSPPPPIERTPKFSKRLSDIMGFSGPAPERINGRLAMIGFVAALAVELSVGTFSKINNIAFG